MRILITGICGFVGNALAAELREQLPDLTLIGFDNLARPGSEINRLRLKRSGVQLIHGDLRMPSDVAGLPAADWVVDAAANPSVLAGVDAASSSRQLFEHNLGGMLNLLEYCRVHRCGLLLLSSSRVYSIAALAALPLLDDRDAFRLDSSRDLPRGVTEWGIGPEFSTQAPVSLYGSTKLASEIVALEYGGAFDFPVWITRCGVLAGAGQFGTPDQGIFAYWINAHLRRAALRYKSFGGAGHQVRDALHPRDLAALLVAQMQTARTTGRRIYTAGGGPANCMSLVQLNGWCDNRFGRHIPESDGSARRFDVPWMVMDNTEAQRDFGWRLTFPVQSICEEIARHAERNPDWLEMSAAQ